LKERPLPAEYADQRRRCGYGRGFSLRIGVDLRGLGAILKLVARHEHITRVNKKIVVGEIPGIMGRDDLPEFIRHPGCRLQFLDDDSDNSIHERRSL
jgi:hypothetical protein